VGKLVGSSLMVYRTHNFITANILTCMEHFRSP